MKEPGHNTKYYSGEEWIGDVPNNWDVKPLFTLFRNMQNKNIGNLEHNVLSLSYGKIVRRDIESNYGLLPESFETYQVVEPNDIILRLTDLQNDKRSLRVGLVEERGIITSAYVNLRPGDKLLPRYAYYLLHNYDICKIFYNLGSGVRQSMNYVDLKKLTFLVPPLVEQSKVVDYLDSEISKVNLSISKKHKLIELLQEKRQAIIDEAVTKGLDPNAPMKDSGIEWLGAVPAQWKLKRLKYFISTIKGFAFKSTEFVDAGVPVVKATDIKNTTVNFDSKVFIDESNALNYEKVCLYTDDIIMSTVGSFPDVPNSAVGQLGIVPEQLNGAMLNQNTVKLINNKTNYILNDFLKLMLLSKSYRRYLDVGARGTANQASLSLEHILDFHCPIPSLEEQAAIIEQLNKTIEAINELILKMTKQIEKLQEYRQSLIIEAVTGKIDVRQYGEEVVQ